jgi:hypothetical protein
MGLDSAGVDGNEPRPSGVPRRESDAMSDEEIEAKLDALIESIRFVQTVTKANSLVLAAIVNSFANCAINRHDYLARLFDDVSARADRIDRMSQQSNDFAREEISKFFASAAASPERAQPRETQIGARARENGRGSSSLTSNRRGLDLHEPPSRA